ncbi:MAG: GIY-YIG nuclease family protein [Gammaproteobacteria bacterium]|nr:GIY-YIG nuclease family protein [Gammaproteobacteria bacterium]
MTEKLPAVYIMANKRNGTIYTGVTANLPARVWQHKNNAVTGFTKKHRLHLLVYYEMHQDIISAATREMQIKKWLRKWKLELIENANPYWRDLYEDIL